MNIEKNKRIIFISMLILITLFSSIGFSYAATTSELRNQQSDIDAKIEQTNTEIAGVKKQMTNALNQINTLNSEISGYENDISRLSKQLDVVNAQITEKTANIEEQQEKYDTQKDLLEQRLVALYEAGETTYLDMLLASDDLSDFISNYYLIEQMAEADDELLTSIENTRKQLESEKAYLDSAKAEIETTTASIAEKKKSLSYSVSQKKTVVSNLTAEEAEYKHNLKNLKKIKEEFKQNLLKLHLTILVK